MRAFLHVAKRPQFGWVLAQLTALKTLGLVLPTLPIIDCLVVLIMPEDLLQKETVLAQFSLPHDLQYYLPNTFRLGLRKINALEYVHLIYLIRLIDSLAMRKSRK